MIKEDCIIPNALFGVYYVCEFLEVLLQGLRGLSFINVPIIIARNSMSSSSERGGINCIFYFGFIILYYYIGVPKIYKYIYIYINK